MTVKSQDDLGKQGRDSEVLISTIEKLERTKKENLLLKIANAELEKVKKQLFVAITGLGAVQDLLQAGFTQSPKEVIENTFNEIKELEK